ncbi:CHAP domain-containing protein [Sphingobium aromaticiconvertens]|uniref:CHAP domain-containing protein n=1 Tax=Sphingobium aromaticiconvertens TaxID=365341 RepID=UPI003018A316
MKKLVRPAALVLLLGLGGLPLPALAAAALKCVPYARAVSGVAIYGDALTWWDQAQNRYKRGHKPIKGAVLAFRPNGPMALGHVAVVSKIVDDRQVLVRHANWSAPGAIEEDVLAIDVSDEGDWSEVRVWHSPTRQMGARINPTFGFIYPDTPHLTPFTPDNRLGSSIRMASASEATQSMKAVSVRRERTQIARNSARLATTGKKGIRIDYDPAIVGYADARLADRSLDDIIEEVKRSSTAG